MDNALDDSLCFQRFHQDGQASLSDMNRMVLVQVNMRQHSDIRATNSWPCSSSRQGLSLVFWQVIPLAVAILKAR